MGNHRFLILCSVIVVFASGGVWADDMGRTFQEGLFSEYGTGDLSEAIELYEKALQNRYEDEELAARTLLRLGICYERAGRDNDAKNSYQQIISRFPAQNEVLDKAIKRLQKLSLGLTGDGYWFRYKGEHIYPIGAGTASIYAGSGLGNGDHVTDDPVRDWKAYIDLLIQHRVNFVRFYPWDFLNHSKVPDYACPWVMINDKPTYDLSRFNPGYWKKLRQIVSYANARDILFEIILFDDDSPWDRHPFNQQCGGALEDRDRYHDLKNRKNVEYQENYVARTITETVEYPNVIYEICNAIGWRGKELSQDMRDWLSHWIEFIEGRIPSFSNHLITVSQHSWSSEGTLDTLWDLPGTDIISVHEIEGSSSALGKDYTHERFLEYWKSDYQKPIMMNAVSFGDMSGHPRGGTRGWIEERLHLWVAFASGGHAARSDFQPFIDTYPSMDSCLHLANFVRQVRFWQMDPLVNFVLGCDGIYYSLGSHEEFIVYIRAKTGGDMKLNLPQGRYSVRWYDPVVGNFLSNAEVVNGETIDLNIPETDTDIVIYVKKMEDDH